MSVRAKAAITVPLRDGQNKPFQAGDSIDMTVVSELFFERVYDGDPWLAQLLEVEGRVDRVIESSGEVLDTPQARQAAEKAAALRSMGVDPSASTPAPPKDMGPAPREEEDVAEQTGARLKEPHEVERSTGDAEIRMPPLRPESQGEEPPDVMTAPPDDEASEAEEVKAPLMPQEEWYRLGARDAVKRLKKADDDFRTQALKWELLRDGGPRTTVLKELEG